MDYINSLYHEYQKKYEACTICKTPFNGICKTYGTDLNNQIIFHCCSIECLNLYNKWCNERYYSMVTGKDVTGYFYICPSNSSKNNFIYNYLKKYMEGINKLGFPGSTNLE